jgi:hypothetical protein
MRTHADTVKAITLNVSQMDGVIPAPKAKEELFEKPPAKLEAPKAEAPKAAEPEAEAEAPKKRESKKAEVPEPTAKKSLASVAAAWSTDEE